MSRMRRMLLLACVIVLAGSSYKLIASYEQSRHSDKLRQELKEQLDLAQPQPRSAERASYAAASTEPNLQQSHPLVSEQPEMLSGYESLLAQIGRASCRERVL